MKIPRILLFAFVVGILLVSGCTQGGNPQGTANSPVTGAQGNGSDTGGSTEPSVTPSVSVTDQQVKDNGVVVSKVASSGPGWIAIHSDSDGAPGPVIGYAAVKSGENTDVLVKINTTAASPTLFAMLHTDAGTIGKYEFPGEDKPVFVDGKLVSLAFKAIISKPSPSGNGTNGGTTPPSQGQVKEFSIEAKQWEFIPGTITVNKGDIVTLRLKSTDVAHGFALHDFGISKKLDSGQEVTVTFTADKTGAFPFFCNVPCGSGHSSMTGKLIVQ
ncbi:MAG: cupredoxin domain-containing protein [Candidatus Micrarchaeota archaeon]